MAIFITLPYVDENFVESHEQAYYEAAWDEFRHTPKTNWGQEFSDGYHALSDYDHQMWEPRYCSDVYKTIPTIVQDQMAEQGVWHDYVRTNNVDEFNQASRDTITCIAETIADTYHNMIGMERA